MSFVTDPAFVILHVRDAAASAAFYADLLGRAPVEASPTFAMFALDSGLRLGLWSAAGVQPPADWVEVLHLLDESQPLATQPVLPLALDGFPERLLMRRAGARKDEIDVLRVWPAPMRLAGGQPLWVARYERMQARQHLRLLTLWLPEPHAHDLPPDLQALAGITAQHDAALRVRIDPP